MLPSSPHVLAVYKHSNGILSALNSLPSEDAQRTLCIDSTTLDVQVAREVSADVIDTAAQMVDAPVSGGALFPHQLTLFFTFNRFQTRNAREI